MKRNNIFLNTVIRSTTDNFMKKVVEELPDIDSLFSSTIKLTAWDTCYNALNKLIYNMDKEQFMSHIYPSPNPEYFRLSPETYYVIKMKSGVDFIRVMTYEKEIDHCMVDTLKIQIFGKHHRDIRNKIIAKIMGNKITGKSEVIRPMSESFHVRNTTFEHIVLEKDVQRRIITSLHHWYKNKEWYEKNNLIHKIGILLDGEPGTGKSTIAKAVSHLFKDATIVMVDGFRLEENIGMLLHTRKTTSGILVVLIEDIDLAFHSRSDSVQMSSFGAENRDKNQQLIFQLLDGVYSTEDTVYIATTNHLSDLDPALIRHGRFDIRERITPFDESRALTFVKLFGYDKDVLDSLDIQYPISPSLLQSKIMEYHANEAFKN